MLPFGMLTDLDIAQLLEATKNKESCLDSHKVLRDNYKSLRARDRLIDKVHFLWKIISFKNGRSGYFIWCTENNTESSKIKDQRNMFQVKEQYKTSEADLKEMNISELPDKTAK